jgi:monoamine oxidase
MARSPLFRALQRSYRLARTAQATGRPIAEIIEIPEIIEIAAAERRKASHLTRRGFLGGAAAALALAGCAPARSLRRPLQSDARVVIVGAGIAGLTAGYRLQQAGVKSRILEAQERVGGRMCSLRGFFPDGQVAELGGELIDTGHLHVQDLAAELGIPLDDFVFDNPSLARDLFFFAGQRHTEADVAAAFVPLSARIARERAGLPDAVTYREPAGAEKLDRMTLAAWLDRAGASGWFRKLLEVAFTTEYGLEADRQSALNLLLMIDPNPLPFRMFGASDERFHVRTGNDSIPAALAARLGDSIERGTVLESVSKAPDGAFRCSVRRGATSATVMADHLLLAIPFTLLRDVKLDLDLPPVKRRAIRELGYGTNAKLMVGFAERVWRAAGSMALMGSASMGSTGSNGSVLTDQPFQLCWETSRLQAGRHGILTNFTGGRHGEELGQGTEKDQADRFAADLDRIFPGLASRRSGKETRFHWPTHPWTRGSYACYLPGQWTSIAGAEGERAGNLHFAGEHCSLAAQGFMEGGCETGETAAQEILADLGMKTARAVLVPAFSRRRLLMAG